MTQDFLRLSNIYAGYGNKIVLKNIDLTVIKGEFIGLIGPNGSGKSTLIKASSSILRPFKGGISLNGNSIFNFSEKELSQKIAVVSQAFDPGSIKAYDYVLMGRFPYFSRFQLFESKKDHEIIEKYIDMTGTAYLMDQEINEMSGGERQLVQIVRALSQEPTLLLLDEPTAHLDIGHQIKILDLIKKLNRQLKITVVMVHHDLNMASEYCDKLALLNEGEIFTYGTPLEVITYEIIEKVYKTPVVVHKNPFSEKPYTILITEEELQKKE